MSDAIVERLDPEAFYHWADEAFAAPAAPRRLSLVFLILAGLALTAAAAIAAERIFAAFQANATALAVLLAAWAGLTLACIWLLARPASAPPANHTDIADRIRRRHGLEPADANAVTDIQHWRGEGLVPANGFIAFETCHLGRWSGIPVLTAEAAFDGGVHATLAILLPGRVQPGRAVSPWGADWTGGEAVEGTGLLSAWAAHVAAARAEGALVAAKSDRALIALPEAGAPPSDPALQARACYRRLAMILGLAEALSAADARDRQALGP